MTDDARHCLNIALLFLELIIDASENFEPSVNALAWAGRSDLQSVTPEASLPSEEARLLFAKIQALSAIIDAKAKQDRP